jgi:phosphohistidine phosphatase
MKQLILFRHAKTEENSSSGEDFDRNLLDRGKEDAKKIGLFFKAHHDLPLLVLCSNANRTVQTFTIFGEVTDFETSPAYLQSLYHASPSQILDVISDHGEECSRIMVVGHNMGISQLADILCERGCEELPTAGMAIIEFKEKIELYKGKLKAFITPKNS